MNAERVCAESGLLVDGENRLLTDPCEYFHPAFGVQVGCGRLRCENCKAWVRGGPPGLGLKRGVQIDLRALHSAPDWSVLSFMEKPYVFHNRMRLYACTCRYWVAEAVAPIDNAHEVESDPDVPWACAGHPEPSLPLTLGPLAITAVTNSDQLVDKILNGSCPRDLERKDALGPEPAVWLAWLYVYLRGLVFDDRLSASIAGRIDDPDPQVVGRVIYFFTQFSRAAGVDKLLARAEAEPHRVAVGYPIPELSWTPSLWNVVVARLEQAPAKKDALDARAAALVDQLLFVPRSDLPHDDLGPTGTVEFERQRRSKHGWDAGTLKFVLDDFARARASERTDVIGSTLRRSSTVFADPSKRAFLADNIAKIDAASPGRWRDVMTLLSDWRDKPEQGHLLVIAGARVIEGGLTTPDEFRAWIQDRRSYGWVDAAWVLPLESMLEQRS